MAGLYFHIPFCKRICAYCDFFRSADLSRREGVVAALHRELDRQWGFLGVGSLRTIYFGGGTPSLLAPAELQRLIDHAAQLFDCSAVGEVTAEVNPDDLTPAYIRELRRTRIDRLSIGVQSFDDAELRMMNRRHTAAQAVRAVREAQDAGFDNLTVDLIFGVKGFGGEVLARSVETLLSLGVQHVSAYHLTIEPGTALHRRTLRGEFGAVDEATSEREFLCVHRALTAAGYEHYEVSNYALPGRRAQHNSAYWAGDPYLGIGPGAHSFNGEVRRWALPSIERYEAEAGEASIYGQERLSDRDRYNETVMVSLRTADGVDPDALERRFGRERRERFLADAERFLRSGTLVRCGGRIALPAEKFLVSDAVIEALFDV